MTVTYQKWNDLTQDWNKFLPEKDVSSRKDIIRIVIESEAFELEKILREVSTNAPCKICGAYVFYPNVHECGE